MKKSIKKSLVFIIAFCLVVNFAVAPTTATAFEIENQPVSLVLLTDHNDRLISIAGITILGGSIGEVVDQLLPVLAETGGVIEEEYLETVNLEQIINCIDDLVWNAQDPFIVRGFLNPNWKHASNPLIMTSMGIPYLATELPLGVLRVGLLGDIVSADPEEIIDPLGNFDAGLLRIDFNETLISPEDGMGESILSYIPKVYLDVPPNIPIIEKENGNPITFSAERLAFLNDLLSDREYYDKVMESVLEGELGHFTELLAPGELELINTGMNILWVALQESGNLDAIGEDLVFEELGGIDGILSMETMDLNTLLEHPEFKPLVKELMGMAMPMMAMYIAPEEVCDFLTNSLFEDPYDTDRIMELMGEILYEEGLTTNRTSNVIRIANVYSRCDDEDKLVIENKFKQRIDIWEYDAFEDYLIENNILDIDYWVAIQTFLEMGFITEEEMVGKTDEEILLIAKTYIYKSILLDIGLITENEAENMTWDDINEFMDSMSEEQEEAFEIAEDTFGDEFELLSEKYYEVLNNQIIDYLWDTTSNGLINLLPSMTDMTLDVIWVLLTSMSDENGDENFLVYEGDFDLMNITVVLPDDAFEYINQALDAIIGGTGGVVG